RRAGPASFCCGAARPAGSGNARSPGAPDSTRAGRGTRVAVAWSPGGGPMAQQTQTATVKPTLGLTGVTMNAMALIAPGAFLWITYQVQMAGTTPGGDSTALDMWAGIVFALVLAFLTALSYSELAKIYPEAGTGSCYYFAEKAFVDKEETRHHKWARLAKLVTGWAAHLFYWVYPGVMVAFMATLVDFIVQAVAGVDIGTVGQIIVAFVF